MLQSIQDKTGVSMGPISLSFADTSQVEDLSDEELVEMVKKEKDSIKSIHSMSTEEWRNQYEKDGMVDLWVEEEFNAGSRLKVLPMTSSLTCTREQAPEIVLLEQPKKTFNGSMMTAGWESCP